jgi:hypothetical protein
MTIRTIPRAALSSSIRILRFPLDRTLALAGSNRATESAKLVVDRAEAIVRGAAGSATGDPELKQDARSRKYAADERAHGLRLSADAERTSEEADQKRQARENEAEEQRRKAGKRAEEKRRSAQNRRDRVKSQAAKTATRKTTTAKQKAAETQEVVEDKSQRTRLSALEAKQDALDKKEAALTAADEAARLRDAATAVKAERKRR